MNEYIKDIVESWGLGTDTHVITAIIVLMSVITMCAVFWLIFHLVSPKSSHFREMCFKVIICTTAVLLVITTFVSIGGNVVIREYTRTVRTNANIRISNATHMDEYEYEDAKVNAALEELFEKYGVLSGMKIYSMNYSYQGVRNATIDYLFPLIVTNNLTQQNYSLYSVNVTGDSDTLSSVIIHYDPNEMSTEEEMVGVSALVPGVSYIYRIVALPETYIPYTLHRYEGLPVLFEIDPNVSYDPNYN